jgi:hypothetical protein
MEQCGGEAQLGGPACNVLCCVFCKERLNAAICGAEEQSSVTVALAIMVGVFLNEPCKTFRDASVWVLFFKYFWSISWLVCSLETVSNVCTYMHLVCTVLFLSSC